jgi:hypothetical protein
MSEDLHKQKEELIRLIATAEPEAKKLEGFGNELVESARFAQDVVAPLTELIKHVPPNQLTSEEVTRQIEGWRHWHDTTRNLQAIQAMVNSFGAVTQAVTNTSVIRVMPIFVTSPPGPPPSPAAESARKTLSQALDRYRLVDRAVASMRRLGLDSRRGSSRTGVDLLNEARGAIERPLVGGGGPVSVLITLRECIDSVITELVRRRPRQEVARGWAEKVASVGRQCAHPSLLADHFSRLGADAATLMNQLSGAKQTDMDRDRLIDSFNQGLLFLSAFMDSIDEGKLRPS